MPKRELTIEIIDAAIEGFQVQKREIDSQIAQLQGAYEASDRRVPMEGASMGRI